ncbi:hypothetical protein CVT26_012858 [Gymnopilus dilepis]|uniref:Uncharacterized protein n=1 Tax=Gymnopilus dilepis TaxID=231916 RepID=A0A409WDK5_9AGAR|nr:hypothetical protein CVT26_012858 [Gymnopilus dilepis]
MTDFLHWRPLLEPPKNPGKNLSEKTGSSYQYKGRRAICTSASSKQLDRLSTRTVLATPTIVNQFLPAFLALTQWVHRGPLSHLRSSAILLILTTTLPNIQQDGLATHCPTFILSSAAQNLHVFLTSLRMKIIVADQVSSLRPIDSSVALRQITLPEAASLSLLTLGAPPVEGPTFWATNAHYLPGRSANLVVRVERLALIKVRGRVILLSYLPLITSGGPKPLSANRGIEGKLDYPPISAVGHGV